MTNPINNNPKTRGNLIPDMNNLRYNITTEQIEAYLQKKMDTAVALVKSGKDVHGNSIGEPVDIGTVTISVKTAAALQSKRLYPLILHMPPTVLVDWKETNQHQHREGLSCFYQNNADGNGSKSSLYKQIADFIETIAYDSTSRAWFLGKDGARHRREWDLTEHDARLVFEEFSKPRLMSSGKGRDATKTVALYVDQFKIFSDMLKMDDDPKLKNKNFEPVLLGTPTKIKDGIYSYYIQRKVYNGKGNGKKSDQAIIEARMQRGH